MPVAYLIKIKIVTDSKPLYILKFIVECNIVSCCVIFITQIRKTFFILYLVSGKKGYLILIHEAD